MISNTACPVVELLPEFTRTVDRYYALNDAAHAPGLSEREKRRLGQEEDKAYERMGALEGLIMKSVARSELGLSLQIIIGHSELVTLHSWSIRDMVQEESADEAKERLAGLFASLLRGRDISNVPSLIREIYLGRSYGDDWIPNGTPPTVSVPAPSSDRLLVASN